MASHEMRILAALAVVSLVVATQPPSVAAQDFEVDRGITFAKGTDFDLKVDVAYPNTAKGPLPALAYFFGGSWAGGSRWQFLVTITQAARRGFVAAAFDYRLTSQKLGGKPEYAFPAQVYDAKAAIRWLRANAAKYGIDPSRIGAVGWSAGGHLSLMIGLTRPGDGLEGDGADLGYSSSVQAVVSLAGVSDLIDEYQKVTAERPYLEDLLGGTPAEAGQTYKHASPVSYIRPGGPPVLSIHGEFDEWVPCQQSIALDARLAELGTPHMLIIKEGASHYDALLSANDEEVWDFLNKYLKPAQP